MNTILLGTKIRKNDVNPKKHTKFRIIIQKFILFFGIRAIFNVFIYLHPYLIEAVSVMKNDIKMHLSSYPASQG